ncbi:MAG: hypothetical protein ACI88H_001891, partial [Cocleimonas sp.]
PDYDHRMMSSMSDLYYCLVGLELRIDKKRHKSHFCALFVQYIFSQIKGQVSNDDSEAKNEPLRVIL